MRYILLKQLLFILFSSLFVSGAGQELFRVPAAFQAVGNASVSLESPLSVFSNPAGAATGDLSAGILFDNRFLLKDLSTRSAFLVLPVQNSRFLLAFSQFGNDGYRETKISAGLARQLSPVLSAGLQFQYFSLFMAENDRRPGTLLADLGVRLQLSDFSLGLQYFNPYGLSVRENTLVFEYPSVIRVGVHKTFQEVLLLTAELFAEQSATVEPRVGIQYLLKKQLSLRCGVETRHGFFSLGVGYVHKNVCTDLTFSYHQYLGLSPSFTLYFQRP